jgi:uncharacterized membrane protein
MDLLLSPYPTARLWGGGLFLAAALVMGLYLLSPRHRRGEGGRPLLILATLTFAAWEILVLLALLDHARTRGADVGHSILLGLVLLVLPAALAVTLLITGDGRLACAACGLIGLGALIVPGGGLGDWLVTAALLGLLALVLALLFGAFWSSALGYAAAALTLLTAGGLTAVPVGELLAELWRGAVATLEGGQVGVAEPWWLLLLLLVPLIVLLSFRSLAGLGPVRRWVAIGLRCLLVVLLTLALAEVHLRHRDETLTVLFVWDRSLSIPGEFEGDGRGPDLRERRLLKFVNDAVAKRGPRRQQDRAGLIVFGRWPRLALPPERVPAFRLKEDDLKEFARDVDDTYTDIGAALKLALASFPEGTGKRIVLISDGNENLGSAEEQARIARQNGVEIDVVPIAAGRRNQNEVLVERVEAPPTTEQDAPVPIRILVRSFNPHVVVARLRLILNGADNPLFEERVRLRQGLNAFTFQQPGGKGEAYAYKAMIIPERVEDVRGKVLEARVTGDRPDNNAAETTVIARGKRAVLLVEPMPGEHAALVERLQAAKAGLRVLSVRPEQLKAGPAELIQYLNRFDAVILANIPAESLDPQQQQVIRSAIHEQGLGLVMVGGPQGYGAGGWQGSEIEKALPVTCDLKSTEVDNKAGLVLIMHASEMAEGNRWQKEIAALAIKKLAAVDMVGVLHYNWNGAGGNAGHVWHIPFQQVGGNRSRLLRLLDSMQPGDMPDAEPSLTMAYNALTKDKTLGNRLIIFISDGDHWRPPVKLLAKLKSAKIPCTTVCVTTHGPGAIKQMKLVALATNGRSYNVTNPKNLPGIYMKETRLISKAYISDKEFVPALHGREGPTEGLPAELPPLHGLVRTTARPGPLVHVPIDKREKAETFPVLAYWHYGLGKVLAFTSDARAPDKKAWDAKWYASGMYSKFWEQVVDWSLRAVENGKNLTLTTELRGGKLRVIVSTRDAKNRPLADVELRGGVITPGLKVAEGRGPGLRFVQKGVGVYEAEVKAEDVGAYFVNVQGKWTVKGKDGKPVQVVEMVRGGVTVPYSPEFADMESNTGLLERLRDLTGGKTYADDAAALEEAASEGEVFRPTAVRSRSLQSVWFWLVLLTGVGLFFDVAARRITLDPYKLSHAAQEAWARLRGLAPAAATPQFLDRLQSRKAQVGEVLEKGKAARRFEPGDAPATAPPVVSDAPLAPPRPAPKSAAPKVGPEGEQEPADFASRLLRAKRRAMEERDRDKGKP